MDVRVAVFEEALFEFGEIGGAELSAIAATAVAWWTGEEGGGWSVAAAWCEVFDVGFVAARVQDCEQKKKNELDMHINTLFIQATFVAFYYTSNTRQNELHIIRLKVYPHKNRVQIASEITYFNVEQAFYGATY